MNTSTSALARPVRYIVGLDGGQNSLGLAAIEVDEHGRPVSLLEAVTTIHDGGTLDHVRGVSRRAERGMARRARRARTHRRARLRDLDAFLTSHGYPTTTGQAGDDAWRARARLATEPVPAGRERDELLALALRHIARHRGARNPWISLPTFLRAPYEPSDAMVKLIASARTYQPDLPDAAPQSVAVTAHPDLAQLRVRATAPTAAMIEAHGSKKDAAKQVQPVLAGRFMAADMLHELRTIATMQSLPFEAGSFLHDAARIIFDMGDPRAGAKENVGRDALDARERRALRASEAFQQYRILAVATTMRLAPSDGEAPRHLSADEVRSVFDLLTTWSSTTKPTWVDVAAHLGVPAASLSGVHNLTLDGEPLSAKTAPYNTTHARIMDAKTPRPVRAWWAKASADERDALVTILANSVGEGSEADDAAQAFLAGLDDTLIDKLASIKLETGRAAYSRRTLERLGTQMLATGQDPSQARVSVFKVPADWKPAPPALNEPTGNAAVDRVLSVVNKQIGALLRAYGPPVAVNIEHVRGGFSSAANQIEMNRELERENKRRRAHREHLAQQLRRQRGLSADADVSDQDLRRARMLQRQNNQCGYCLEPLTFDAAELDHIVPRRGPGSTNRDTNFMATCHACNRDKGNTAFAVWAARHPRGGAVTPERVMDAMLTWNLTSIVTGPRSASDPGTPNKDGQTPYDRQVEAYLDTIRARLRRTSHEDADERTLESTAYMARELARRIGGFYDTNGHPGVPVGVYQGTLTAVARRASGIEKQISMIGGRGKQRLDRRHHVVDAATIALMRQGVCTVLSEREQLRADENASGQPTGWRDWDGSDRDGRDTGNALLYRQWRENMQGLVVLLNDALTHDLIPVRRDLRLTMSGQAHEDTVRAYDKRPVSDAFSADDILRCSTPQLWHALTRQADYTPTGGLPANPHRRLRVGGTHLGPDDTVNLFPLTASGERGDGLNIALRHGYANAGSEAIHHARIYRITSKGKPVYAMVRVLTGDLTRGAYPGNPLTRPLTPDMTSYRYAADNVRQALDAGTAAYLGSLYIGDEVQFGAPQNATAMMRAFLDAFPDQTRWVVAGCESNTVVRLKPCLMAEEGLPDPANTDAASTDAAAVPPAVKKAFKAARLTVGVLFGTLDARIIRRDVLGHPMPRGTKPTQSWAPERE